MARGEDAMTLSDMLAAEWRALIRDRRMLAILLLVPVAYLVLFGFLYSEHKVRHLPTIYVDEDQSALSREILEGFSASEGFQLIGPVASEAEALDAVQRGEASMALVIPPDLSRTVKRGQEGKILAVIDGSNMIIANSALQNANAVVQTFSGGIAIQRMEARGLSPDYGYGLGFGYRMLFNPTLNYSDFLLLGLAGTVFQQVILLGVSLGVTREKEQGRWGAYLAGGRRPGTVFLAKTLPYFLIGLFDVLLGVGVAVRGFGVPFQGAMMPFVALSVAFVLVLVALGFAASLFSRGRLEATQVSMLVAVPSFLLSGFTWPFLAMPAWVAALGHCLPLTYYVDGLREVALKGNGWLTMRTDIEVLLGMAVGLIVVSLVGVVIQGRISAKKWAAERV
ncbi:ABC transporter permease [Kyrpidia spormannii]|nr:ABC transporter permease [Kyrpidia spormannii]